MKKIKVSSEIIQEARNILDCVYAPLDGFLDRENLESVLDSMRLKNGKVWSMPITLAVSGEVAQEIGSEENIILSNGEDELVLSDISIYDFDKAQIARKLFGTDDKNHPGISKLLESGDYFVSGKLERIKKSAEKKHKLYFTPKETKEIFKKYGWENVVAFQTRNPPHRSHEYLQKKALDGLDGIFINPVIGPKKKGDFHDDHIIGAYEILLKHHYPAQMAHLGTFHTHMRYAGPREAVFHALVRKNFGCTHMIIGRDHAGVGDYYGTYDAHCIFDQFSEDELGIKILKFENVSFCNTCGDMVMEKDCEHLDNEKVHLSGTKLREELGNGGDIKDHLMRKEVFDYLLSNKDKLFV